MKRYIVLLFTLMNIAPSGVIAQEWAPVGTIWHYQRETFSSCNYPYEFVTYESIKDTLVNSKNCRIIEAKFFDYSFFYDTLDWGREIMYGDSNSVFVYKNNKFYKVFNFSALSGDTITVIDTVFNGFFHDTIYEYDLFEYIIDSISVFVFNGDSLKKFYISPTDSSDWVIDLNYFIIEGIGIDGNGFGFGGFLGRSINVAPAGSFFGPLRCYQDQQISYNFLGIPCDTFCADTSFSSNKLDLEYVYQINAFPNPFGNELTMSFSSELNETGIIQIVDYLGQAVYSKRVRIRTGINTIKLDVSAFSKGLYLLNMQTGNYRLSKPIIKL